MCHHLGCSGGKQKPDSKGRTSCRSKEGELGGYLGWGKRAPISTTLIATPSVRNAVGGPMNELGCRVIMITILVTELTKLT